MRLLILGGSGLIGHKLWQNLRKRFDETYVVIKKKKQDFSSIDLFNDERVLDSVDVSDFGLLKEILFQVKPQVILNCIGITKRNPEIADIQKSISLNSLFPHMIAEWGRKNNARIFQFSTDCVFNGKEGNYTENSLPNAEDIYGRTKALGEANADNCLTIRTSFIGREIVSFTELLEWLISQNGKAVKGYCKAFYTGVSTIFLSRIVCDLIERFPNLCGIYQLAGEVISKYELLCLMRNEFKLNIDIIPDNEIVCLRTLNGEKLKRATGIKIPRWEEMAHELSQDNDIYRSRVF